MNLAIKITQGEFKTRRALVPEYTRLIRAHSTEKYIKDIKWRTSMIQDINRAIVSHWSRSGLAWIKREARRRVRDEYSRRA